MVMFCSFLPPDFGGGWGCRGYIQHRELSMSAISFENYRSRCFFRAGGAEITEDVVMRGIDSS